MNPAILPGAIFVATYAVVAFGGLPVVRIDRTGAAIVGAILMVVAGNLTLVGSIANLIVLQGARRHGITITFWDYTRVGLPVTVVTLAFGIWWMS